MTYSLTKLKNLRVKNTAFNWFKSYLDSRVQRLEVDGHLSELHIKHYLWGFPEEYSRPSFISCHIDDIFTNTELATFF
jgi:hypothetical protein